MDDSILVNRVRAAYLGDSRVEISAGGTGDTRDPCGPGERRFVADQRTELDRAGAGFCPLELVAAALGS